MCPSDAVASYTTGKASNSGNYGTGIQKYRRYNAVIIPFRSIWDPVPAGLVRSADITDGVSNTAKVSEILIGNKSKEVLRTLWDTPRRLVGPDQLDEFASLCASEGPTTDGQQNLLGGSWTTGAPGMTWYNHVNTPNKPSCKNGGRSSFWMLFPGQSSRRWCESPLCRRAC